MNCPHAPSTIALMSDRRYRLADFNQLPGVACPCGTAYRAFADVPEFPGTIHRTEIHTAARPHFHRKLTETYYVLEAEPNAFLELDGDVIPARPGVCVVIPPGVVHRAVGRMVILNIVVPKFDPSDEVLLDDPKDHPSEESL
ncbi:MAG: cupin domain-containing protein [Anaerolineae bacterium]